MNLKHLITKIIFGVMCVSSAHAGNFQDTVKKDTSQLIKKDTLRFVSNKPIIPISYQTSSEQGKIGKDLNSGNTSSAKSSNSSFSPGTDAGRMVGALDISASGAATYTIPIAVPPGINGVVPKVSLNYNSQSGNGIAGYGWNVGGLSAITRISTTSFHDGVVGGVNADLNDKYALDGQRLIIKSGTYGVDGAVYQTENYSNIKVISKGATGIGPTYFEVYYPDGSFAVFGQNSNSYNRATYAIDYLDNPQGIRISYTYTNTGVILISKISYGTKGSATPINHVNFNYSARARNEEGYMGSYPFAQTQILTNIDVVGNGIDYRHYTLTHNLVTGLNYQRLESIQEKSGDNAHSFEPIIFTYDSTSGAITPSGYTLGLSGIAGYNSKVVTADFTGNGKMDFLLYPATKNTVYLTLDPQGGSTYTQPTFQLNVDPFEDVFAVNTLNAQNQLFSGQGFAFVQQPDATTIKFQTWLPGLYANIATLSEKVWNNVSTTGSYYSNCQQAFITGEKRPRQFFSGDFNGDGLTDIIAINTPFSQTYSDSDDGNGGCTLNTQMINYGFVEFINLDRRVTTNFITQSGVLTSTYTGADKIYTADFNGDGKTDILHIKSGHMYVYGFDANNMLVPLWDTSDTRIVTNFSPLLGDYNGDGKTDVMFPTSNTVLKEVFATFVSNGKQFFKVEGSYYFANNADFWNGPYLYAYNLIANDINGDGKTDIVGIMTRTQNSSTVGYAEVTVYPNMGFVSNIPAPGPLVGPTSFTLNNATLVHSPIPLFFSNSEPNFSLEIGLLSLNTMTLFKHEKDLRKEALMTKVSQDGVELDVEYKELKSGNMSGMLSLYSPLSVPNQTYPYVDIEVAPGLNVVSKLTRTYDSNSLYQYFGYKGAVTHTAGLGFLGFNETERTNWHTAPAEPNALYTTTVYDPQLRGAVLRSFVAKTTFYPGHPITTKVGTTPDIVLNSAVTGAQTAIAVNSVTLQPGFTANGANGVFIARLDNPATGIDDGGNNLSNYITRTDYNYKTELQPNKVFINTPTTIVTKDLLNKTNTIVTSTYDSYYNVTNQTTNYSGVGSKTVEYVYDNNPGGGYIGRLLNKKETAVNGGDSFSTEEQYNNYVNFLPTQVKKKGNGTPFITENYTYDTYGNLTNKQLVTANGTRTSSMTYDASGRFVNTSTDLEGLVSTMVYNTSTGNLTSKTNPYSQVITYDYDAWGRPTLTTNYLNHTSSRAYNKSGSDIEFVVTDDEGRSKTTITNALGQTRFVITKDVLAQNVGKEYQYDAYDRQVRVSEPGIGSYTQWNEIEYDEYSRARKITAFNGKVSNIAYNGLITTVNDGTKTTVITKNALDNVVSTQDPGGTINNSYFANGNLKSAEYNGSTQTIQQDGWGQKTQLIDPSAGTYTYTYNQFGEPLTQVTPKGTTTYTYDGATGKILTKNITGDNTGMSYTYAYDAVTKLPTTTALTNADGNNTTYTYGYDGNKRLISTIEDNLHARFIKTVTYDGYGRVATETSEAKNKTNNITVSKTILNTYQYGELKKITDNNTGVDIWEVTTLNARGQVTMAQLGVNLKETSQFDQYGFSTEIKTERITPSVTELMKLTYSFDVQRGNLSSRSNTAFSWSESFTYDNLDRLTGFTDNDGTQTQSYDGGGRITANSKLGTYNYTGNSYRLNNVTNLTPFAAYHYQNDPLQNISYNAFKSPVEIIEAGKEIISFQYNGAQGRAHMYYGGPQADKMTRPFRRHYSEDGSMEITEDIATGKTSFVFYMGGDAYAAPAIWKHEQSSAGTNSALYYLHRDYQGSILMITDINGTIKEKRQFDAWGNIVKLTDGNGVDLAAFAMLDRGYTGHEHLLGVGLIHMNGRLYDPLLHRFLGPDNYIQDISNTQNHNRYSYALNNPLRYTDPSGEILFPFLIPIIGKLAATLVSAAVTGAIIGGAGYTASVAFSNGGFKNWNAGQFWKAVGIGAASGVITGGIGEAFGAIGNIGHEALRAAAHGVSNGTIAAFTGGDFGSGFLSGALGSLASYGFSAIPGSFSNSAVGTLSFAAIAGGVGSELAGDDFWRGAATGTIVAGLNHLSHLIPINDDPDPFNNPNRNPAQDKPLTDADIRNLEKQGFNHRDKKLNGKGGGKHDLYKDKMGNVYEKPKNAAKNNPGEPIGYNLNVSFSHFTPTIKRNSTFVAPPVTPIFFIPTAPVMPPIILSPIQMPRFTFPEFIFIP